MQIIQIGFDSKTNKAEGRENEKAFCYGTGPSDKIDPVHFHIFMIDRLGHDFNEICYYFFFQYSCCHAYLP